MLSFMILYLLIIKVVCNQKEVFKIVDKIKERMSSDKAAVGTVEAVLLIALAVFAALAVNRYILNPLSKTSEGIGKEIEKMDPRKK